MSKTIKELADELGVSKAEVRKYIGKEFRHVYTETDRNGVITIDFAGCKLIAEYLCKEWPQKDVSIDLTAEEKRVAERYAAAKGMTLPDAFKEALFEKIEDEYDSAVAEDAYAEYVASGCKATPINELWKELDHDEEQPNAKTVVAIEEVEENLQGVDREADLTEQRYSSDEVLQTIQENLTFRSSLSTEKIERNFEGLDLFSEIMAGLEEALEYTKGNLKARTRTLTTEDGPKAEGAFAEQILDELIASGLTSNALLEEFRKRQAQVRPAVKTMIAEAYEAALGNGEYYTYDDVFGVENEPQMKADETADPFFSESNMEFLRRGVEALNAGKGIEHEIIDIHDHEKTMSKIYEAKLVNEGLADLENGKTVDGNSVRARIEEKYGM